MSNCCLIGCALCTPKAPLVWPKLSAEAVTALDSSFSSNDAIDSILNESIPIRELCVREIAVILLARIQETNGLDFVGRNTKLKLIHALSGKTI